MARDSNGLRFLPQQLLDYGELQWAQDEQDERRRLARLAQTMEAGWFGEYRGPTPDFGWEIYDGGAGELSLRTLDASGVPLQRDPSRPAPENDTVTLGVDPIGQVLEQGLKHSTISMSPSVCRTTSPTMMVSGGWPRRTPPVLPRTFSR